MKFLKYLLGIIALFIIVGLFMPASTHVERSIIIQAPQQLVFSYVNDYRKFNQWSPWLRRDPATKIEYSGPASGVGSKMSWSSENPQTGSGWQKITESRPYEYVQVFLDFGSSGQSDASYSLSSSGAGTRIVWALDMDHGWDLMSRIFGLMMDSMIGPDYETGLLNLKQLVEAELAD